MEKRCRVCMEFKNILFFSKDNSTKDKLKNICKKCASIYIAAYRLNNINAKDRARKCQRDWILKNKDKIIGYNTNTKEYRKMWHLKSSYGITIDDYNNMFIKQNGKCSICNRHQSELKRSFGVDHNHETGNVRELLCAHCNTAIGLFGEDILILEKAIQYLKKYGRQNHSPT